MPVIGSVETTKKYKRASEDPPRTLDVILTERKGKHIDKTRRMTLKNLQHNTVFHPQIFPTNAVSGLWIPFTDSSTHADSSNIVLI